MIDRMTRDIRSRFAAIHGGKIVRYETAELLLMDGTWESWPDLPIRLYTDSGKRISISWSRFDDLWIADDLSLPFSVEGSTIRWVGNGIEILKPALGATIGSVMLGRGEMSIEGREIEIWTRLLIQVDERWLEIFNALDENGYALHSGRPTGTFIRCL